MKFEEQKSCFKKKKKKKGIKFPDNIGLRIYKCWLNIYIYIYV